jgi:hypothetical protein
MTQSHLPRPGRGVIEAVSRMHLKCIFFSLSFRTKSQVFLFLNKEQEGEMNEVLKQ